MEPSRPQLYTTMMARPGTCGLARTIVWVEVGVPLPGVGGDRAGFGIVGANADHQLVLVCQDPDHGASRRRVSLPRLDLGQARYGIGEAPRRLVEPPVQPDRRGQRRRPQGRAVLGRESRAQQRQREQ